MDKTSEIVLYSQTKEFKMQQLTTQQTAQGGPLNDNLNTIKWSEIENVLRTYRVNFKPKVKKKQRHNMCSLKCSLVQTHLVKFDELMTLIKAGETRSESLLKCILKSLAITNLASFMLGDRNSPNSFKKKLFGPGKQHTTSQ